MAGNGATLFTCKEAYFRNDPFISFVNILNEFMASVSSFMSYASQVHFFLKLQSI